MNTFQATCICKPLPWKSHVVDILFSGRAAPGQNVRIPRARAAVSVGTVATRCGASLTLLQSCTQQRREPWLGRRDSKTHLPSQTIHCGQQTVTAEEDFLFAFLSKWPLQIKIVKETWCVVQDSTVVHRPHEWWGPAVLFRRSRVSTITSERQKYLDIYHYQLWCSNIPFSC